ncbi:hypothetical protein BpHYR1_046069 [Brachionus plicatilis]|uniref:Uncharacterized protein n=1 Tax=Brachionus plicatilis TaxID=10195 RepID=A0A3M7SRE1_BRAPC|nr:hypothetical protein BpHYR1_046069 [Brachionus plicatilis]
MCSIKEISHLVILQRFDLDTKLKKLKSMDFILLDSLAKDSKTYFNDKKNYFNFPAAIALIILEKKTYQFLMKKRNIYTYDHKLFLTKALNSRSEKFESENLIIKKNLNFSSIVLFGTSHLTIYTPVLNQVKLDRFRLIFWNVAKNQQIDD